MSLADQIRADLKSAMLAKDADRVAGLRMVQAEILKKEKEKVGTQVDDGMVTAILQALAKQRRDSIEQFRSGGREEMAQKEEAELKLILSYLPQGLSDAEIDGEIEKAIAAAGATSVKDQGKVMGPLMKALRATGKPFDGNAVQARVKAKLEGS